MYQRHRLPNGIRIIHRPISSLVAHCGLMINAGSRDELKEEQGLAHFIEHVIFKGTKKRKAFHILSNMENVGGEINAYTSKEETCLYGSFMHPYYPRWFELLADILFNSTFPGKELQKEKDIIIDEINSYKDSPAEQIMDDFDELIFDGHPLGRNILGTPEHLQRFNPDQVNSFIKANYCSEEMVLCSVGKIDFRHLIKLAERFFGDTPTSSRQRSRELVNSYNPSNKAVTRRNHQVHCVLGNRAYSMSHPHKNALLLLNNILGGPGMNCRLNMSVREKHGFCYHIESMYQAYSDSGIMNIYFGTDPGYREKTISLIYKELKQLRTNQLGSLQLKRAKNQLIGQAAIAFESNLNETLAIGKSLLHLNKVDSMDEMNTIIEAISASELLEVANEVYDPSALSILAYKPS